MMENKTKIDLKNKSVFITGVAGFIGSNLARRLLSTVEGVKVVGLDNMNHYYDVRLKEARLNELEQFENFSFVKGNLADKAVIESIFEQYKPEIVVNLGAQAGVRYSITNPDAYVEANLIGFYNILEACRHSYDEGHTPVEHLVYASSSSVYTRSLPNFRLLRLIENLEVYMNYNSGNARRNFYAKWDKIREKYRAAGMNEDAIQKMYEYDLAVFNDDRAHHRYDVEIPSADDSENRNNYADFVRATTVTDTYHETKTCFAWVGEVQNERLQAGLEMLSVDDLKLLTLYAYEGYTVTEISKVLGVSQPTISIKIKRITNFLKNFNFNAMD